MNEVKHIHIGRQQFTVSVEAYSELRNYLGAITKKAGESGADVAEEVELRMAELLTERGITEQKVILSKDIEFLKSQLGEPSDFSEDAKPLGRDEISNDEAPKRLFRDTENGLVAGVAAGLAAYFGIDAVIIRILFIGLAFAGGSGILIYLLLWLLVPEAKTASDRLVMEGKAATVENLRRLVEQADVPGAAQRAGNGLRRVLVLAGKILLGISGVALAAIGIALMIAAIMALVYGLAHGANVVGTHIFPMGFEQQVILISGVAVLAVLAVLLMILGLTMVRRRKVVATWGMVTLIAVFIVAASIGGGLSFDAGSKIRMKYQALQHTKVVELKPFTSISLSSQTDQDVSVPIGIEYGQTPKLRIRTLGNVDTSAIVVKQTGLKLAVDTSHFHPDTHCNFICPYGDANTSITIVTPDSELLTNADPSIKPEANPNEN